MSNTDVFIDKVKHSIPNGMNLIEKFFYTFSRFECALKNTPEYLMGDSDAKPNWDVFANDLKEHFNPEISDEVSSAVNFIINEPPRKQINQNGSLVWRTSVLDANVNLPNKLSVYIRRVRNNLMHGGKFNGSYNPESRNFQLLKSSLIVLDYYLELNKDVKANFLKNIE